MTMRFHSADIVPEAATVLIAAASDAPEIGDPTTDGVELLGRVTTGNDAVTRVVSDLPDVLVLDVRIDDIDARAVCRRLGEWAPATRIIAISPLDDELLYTTVVSGACSTLTVDVDAAGMAHAIGRVARGESMLLARTASRLLNDIDAWAARSRDPLYPPPTLTATEREVLCRVGNGSSTAQIADLFGVTIHLVNVHAGYAVTKLHRYLAGVDRLVSVAAD